MTCCVLVIQNAVRMTLKIQWFNCHDRGRLLSAGPCASLEIKKIYFTCTTLEYCLKFDENHRKDGLF